MGIEPTTLAWKARVLPLNYTRIRKLELLFSFVDHAYCRPLCLCVY